MDARYSLCSHKNSALNFCIKTCFLAQKYVMSIYNWNGIVDVSNKGNRLIKMGSWT